jgi:hypothetical protein
MVACSRRKLLGRDRKAVYHCSTRCVRRAFLCGRDPATGRDYSHRRDWILTRAEQLCGLFALVLEFHAVMSNHFHLVLWTLPAVSRRWSDREVARRWLTATRLAKCPTDALPQVNEKAIEKLVKDKKKFAKLRRRLSSVSWFMGILSENIARRANQEDQAKGRFWESRYRVRECTDQKGILLCGIYVDLNTIKAGEAQSPETARYTSVFQRLLAQPQRKNASDRADGWLGELTRQAESQQDEQLACTSRTGRRACDLGLLPISLGDYVQLLRMTIQLWQSGERRVVPRDLEAMLERLEIHADAWWETLENYEKTFCHAVGSPSSLAGVAQRMEAKHLKGTAACRRVFA